jgi:hypothetical protein
MRCMPLSDSGASASTEGQCEVSDTVNRDFVWHVTRDVSTYAATLSCAPSLTAEKFGL